MNAGKWVTILGLLITSAGAVFAAVLGTLTPSTGIATESRGDFRRQQQNTVWWFRFGLGLIALGAALQVLGTLLGPSLRALASGSPIVPPRRGSIASPPGHPRSPRSRAARRRADCLGCGRSTPVVLSLRP